MNSIKRTYNDINVYVSIYIIQEFFPNYDKTVRQNHLTHVRMHVYKYILKMYIHTCIYIYTHVYIDIHTFFFPTTKSPYDMTAAVDSTIRWIYMHLYIDMMYLNFTKYVYTHEYAYI
jgi:hypothetical protein